MADKHLWLLQLSTFAAAAAVVQRRNIRSNIVILTLMFLFVRIGRQ